MYPIKCGFCQHGNPANSRFCNSCGAPLAAEPCPHCGAVNDVMAATCQQCDAPLGDSLPNEFFLPLPPEVPANPRAALASTEITTDTEPARRHTSDEDGLPGIAPSANGGSGPTAEPCAHCGAVNDTMAATCQKCGAPSGDSLPNEFFLPLPPEVPENSRSALSSTETTVDPDPARPHTPSDGGLPATAPSADEGSGAFHHGVASNPRQRALKSYAMLLALAVAVYFAYRHFRPGDAMPRPASTGETKDIAIPAAPSKPIAAPAAADPTVAANPVVGADAPAAVPAPDRGASAVSQAKAPGGDDAGGKGGQSKDLFSGDPARLQAPKDTARGPDPDQRPLQERPKTSAAGTDGDARRQSANAGAGTAQRPPGLGPCTDALAALGLCTNENTQRREP